MLSGMVADVGYLVRALHNNRGYHKSNNGEPPMLITRDLLGESFSDISDDSQELDLDLQVPAGWEKRLDLKSGKIYLQKCSSSKTNRPATKPIKRPLDNNLDLKLDVSPFKSTYESVCTLDKVKSALDREKHEQLIRRKFFIPRSSKSPSSSSGASLTNVVTTNLATDEKDENENSTTTTSMSLSSQDEGSLKLSAAGCSNCLMYVMISDENPMCPNCNSKVALPVVKKKPRIDLDLNLYLLDEMN